MDAQLKNSNLVDYVDCIIKCFEAFKTKNGRKVILTGSSATGNTATAFIFAKESDLEKSVHLHTDGFYHYICRGQSLRICRKLTNKIPL